MNEQANIQQGEELDNLINQLTNFSKSINFGKDELDYLHHAKAIMKRRLISFPKENESRIESIIREVKEYSNIDFTKYNHITMLLATSSQHALMMEETDKVLSEIMSMFRDDTKCLWGQGFDEKLDDKLLLIMVCSY